MYLEEMVKKLKIRIRRMRHGHLMKEVEIRKVCLELQQDNSRLLEDTRRQEAEKFELLLKLMMELSQPLASKRPRLDEAGPSSSSASSRVMVDDDDEWVSSILQVRTTGEDRETAPEEDRETAIEETDALDEIGDMEVAHVQEMTSRGEKYKKTTLCYICQANMSSKKEYIRHLARQHGKLSYQCPRCSRPLSSESLMKHHMQTRCHMKDSIIRPVDCQLCPLSYTSKYNMRRHFQCEHSVRKGVDFKCEHCGKPFSCLHRAKQHAVKCREGLVVRSLREKTFECKFCHKMLASSSSRSHHVRRFH
ncbi:hypothetical protein ACOMHN_005886 [Nucella lapillus]